MRVIIRNMSELSDSREMMEAKTHPAITIFIAIVIILLAVGFTWSFTGEMDEVAKASAVVRPNDKVSSVEATSLGTVDKIYIKEGQFVEKGALLMSLDHKELKMQWENRDRELARSKQEIGYLEKYLLSIQQHANHFDDKTPGELFYYNLVEQYLLDYSQKEITFQSNRLQAEQSMNEALTSKNSIDLNIRASQSESAQNQEQYLHRIEQLEQELEYEKQLKNAMESTSNTLPEMDSVRTERYRQYLLGLEQLHASVAEAQKKYDQSAALGERFVSKSKLNEELSQLNALKLQLEQFKQKAMMDAESNIDRYEKELEEARRSLEIVTGKDSSTVLEQESLKLEESKWSENYNRLLDQDQIMKESTEIELKKFKLDRLVQIQSALEEKTKQRITLQEQVEQLRLAVEKQSFVSPISGIVHILTEMNAGTTVQAGESLLSIIPQEESMFKMNIAVPNHEIGQIEIGDKVNLNFHAFPKQNFGSLTGVVTSIGTDSMIQQDGRSYYYVEASIANEPLVNRKGEYGEIRVGMTAEAYIVTNSKKIIHFLLEKINLRE